MDSNTNAPVRVAGPQPVTRRTFLTRSTRALAAAGCLPAVISRGEDEKVTAHQATGTRVGEVTDRTAIVWTRITAASGRNNAGQVIPGRAQDYRAKDLPEVTMPPEQLEGACPGAPGRVRLRYGTAAALKSEAATEWVVVNEATDFIHQFGLRDLQPGTRYFYTAETTDPAGRAHADFRKYHRFHRVKGGFLSTRVTPAGEASTILFQHRDVTGAVVYEWSAKRVAKP